MASGDGSCPDENGKLPSCNHRRGLPALFRRHQLARPLAGHPSPSVPPIEILAPIDATLGF